ncbi:hypothetical protein F66182_3153 [Fusarium sp. NRRL 66182]|nr:hypothetical protein F66182_3153 [Fusarium sp. NRRL 66182]
MFIKGTPLSYDLSADAAPSGSLITPSSSSTTATSAACGPEPLRYHVFHNEQTPGKHQIYIPAGPPRPPGYVFSVADVSRPDHPQPALPLVTDHIALPEQMDNIHKSELVGSIASQDLEQVQAMIKDHRPSPWNPQERPPSAGEPSLCERWVRDVIAMLLEVGILEPPPPPPAATGGHRLPRHHHTAHCIHQRLHSHHPYRRRNRPSVNRNN